MGKLCGFCNCQDEAGTDMYPGWIYNGIKENTRPFVKFNSK